MLWGIALTLLLSFSTVHAEDFWQDTLWIRKIPLGGHFFSKIMFHPDGKSIFAASDQFLFRYDVQTGTIISTYEMKEKGYIRDYEISRDRQNLILITDIRNNGNIPCFELWNIDTGYVRHYRYDNIKSESQTSSIAMGKNDSLLYVGVEQIDGSVYIIDYRSGKYIETKKGAGRYIDISPDGKYMASAYLIAGAEGRTKLIEIEKWLTISFITDIFEPKFSPDGKFMAGRKGMSDFLLYDVDKKESYILKAHTGQFGNVCFTDDSKYLITVNKHESENNGGYRVWSTESKKGVYIAPWYFFNASMIAINNEGKNIAAFGSGTIVMNRTPSILVGINNNDISEKNVNVIFAITPNPSTNHLRITLLTNNLTSDFIIVDNHGEIKEIISRDLFINTPYYDYLTTHLPIGAYTLSVSAGNSRYSSPFIINR